MKKAFVVLTMLLLLPVVGWTTDWYVRPAGGNYGTEDGTSYENAWDGFSNIDWSSIQPGDTLWLDGSATYKEKLTIGASGTSGAYITIDGSYGGGKAKLVGVNEVTSWLGPDANGEYYITHGAIAMFLEDELRITRGTAGNLDNSSESQWDYSGGYVYYKPGPGKSVTDSVQEISEQAAYILVDGKGYVVIKNIAVYGNCYHETGFSGSGVEIINGSHHINIIGCRFNALWYMPIEVQGSTVHDILVSGCSIYDAPAGVRVASGAYNVIVRKCNIRNIGNLYNDDSIGVDVTGVEVTGSCDSVIVEENIIDNGGWFSDKSDPDTPPDGGIAVYTSTNTDILRNIVRNWAGKGMYHHAIGGSASGTIAYNLICNCGGTPYASNIEAISITGDGTYTATVDIINNTLYGNKIGNTGDADRELGIIQIGYYTTTTVANNALYHGSSVSVPYQILVSTNNVDAIFKNNCYYNLSAWNRGYTVYTTLSSWMEASGEIGALYEDQLFTSTYHLSANSPCISAGTTISGFHETTLDIDKQPILGTPDIGCDERKALWWDRRGWHMQRMY